MKVLKAYLPVLILLLTTWFSNLHAQEYLRLNFQGLVIDGKEKVFSSDEMIMVLTILEESSGTSLYNSRYTILTDEKGWFGFEIPDFQRFVDNDGNSVVTLQMEFYATENSTWAAKDYEFLVTYTITKIIRNDSLLFEIERMEGTKLKFVQNGKVLYFHDTYPFAYLQGGFMLSVATQDQFLVGLRSVIKEDLAVSGEPARSRGMKGGFAVGGYQQKDR